MQQNSEFCETRYEKGPGSSDKSISEGHSINVVPPDPYHIRPEFSRLDSMGVVYKLVEESSILTCVGFI